MHRVLRHVFRAEQVYTVVRRLVRACRCVQLVLTCLVKDASTVPLGSTLRRQELPVVRHASLDTLVRLLDCLAARDVLLRFGVLQGKQHVVTAATQERIMEVIAHA